MIMLLAADISHVVYRHMAIPAAAAKHRLDGKVNKPRN